MIKSIFMINTYICNKKLTGYLSLCHLCLIFFLSCSTAAQVKNLGATGEYRATDTDLCHKTKSQQRCTAHTHSLAKAQQAFVYLIVFYLIFIYLIFFFSL